MGIQERIGPGPAIEGLEYFYQAPIGQLVFDNKLVSLE